MEQKILDFMEEKFRYEYPRVLFCPERLMIQVGTGANASGSFVIKSDEKRRREDEVIRGYFTCEDHRMKVEPLTFSAEEETIHFFYDTSFLKLGEKIENKIYLISSHGEYELPYTVEIVDKSLSYKENEIRNLIDFSNLAYQDFQAATRIFYNENFPKVLLKDKEEERLLRKGLLFSSDKAHALEEFLVYIGAKERVVLSTEREDYEYQLLGKKMKYLIPLKKSTWGYMRAELSLANGIVNLSKTRLTEEDFKGDSYDLEIEVDPQKLSENKYKDSLWIRTPNQEIEISLRILAPNEAKLVFAKGRKKSDTLTRAIKIFYDYRMNQASKQELSLALRVAFRSRDEKDMREESLYLNAYVDYLNGNEEEVRQFLLENERWEKTPLAGALHLYLQYLLAEETEKRGIKRKIEELASQYSVMEAYLFILQMEDRFRLHNDNKLELLSRLYKAGLNKIFLFLETWLVLNESPNLFKMLNPLLERTFAKALRYGFRISKELSDRFVKAASNLKEYRPLCVSVLKEIYETEKSEEALTAILHQLLKSDKCYAAMEDVVRAGIQRGIKLTGIYELYAKHLKEGEKIEPTAFTYFLFGEGPNSSAKLLMYSYLVQHKEEADYAEIYGKYEEKIRAFTLESLALEKIGKNYLILYKEFMKKRDFVKVAGKSLSNLVYKNFLKVKEPRFCEVVVLHKGLNKPKSYKLGREGCYIDKLRFDVSLLFMDEDKRLFVPEKGFVCEEFFRYENYIHQLYQNRDENILTLLEVFRQGEKGGPEAHFEICKRLIGEEMADADLKKLAKKGLIRYYDTQNDFVKLETAIETLSLSEYSKKDGRYLADIIIKNQIKERIYEAVKYYGVKRLPISSLENFVTEAIQRENKEEEALVVEAALTLLRAGRGKESLYHWLAHKLEAPVSVLFDLSERMQKEEALPGFFVQKVFEQVLFTEVIPEGFDESSLPLSLRDGDELTKAYCNYRYYRYLLNDYPLGNFMEKRLAKEALRAGSHLQTLSYLKLLSKKEGLETEEKEFVTVRLLCLTEEGLILPFFKDFIGKCSVPAELENIMFVSCHADAGDEVSIHYTFRFEGKEETGSMIEEWMRNVYQGIFVKEFLLFADERVKYYISDKNEVELTSGELGIDLEELLSDEGRGSLYAEINQIYLARSLDDKKALYDSMKHYIKQREVLKEVFALPLPDRDNR